MCAKNSLLLVTVVAGLMVLASPLLPRSRHERPRVAFETDSVRAAAARMDAALEQLWSEAGVEPAPPADELLIARRLSLALCGTIPSLEEIRRFESLPDERRLDDWLNELLADRRSSDYLAERLARAYVGTENGPFLLFRRRRFVSWLADQLSANRPYDEIVRHLIADTGLWTDTPAVNFVTVTINPGDENRPDANRLAARVARSMLGIRLDCAECHDHPFAQWKQEDFAGLAAFFGGTRQSLRGIRDDEGTFQVDNRQTGQSTTVSPHVPFAAELLPVEGGNRERLAGWVTHADNRAFAREAVNRAWAILFGRPLVEPIDDLPLDGPFPAPLELLADDFCEHEFDFRRLLQVIAATRTFRLDSKLDELPSDAESYESLGQHWAAFPLTPLRPEQVVGGILQASSLATIDYESNIVIRLARAIGQQEFVARYGDRGEEEFAPAGGTIPQRLLLMNGELVAEKTKEELLSNAATRIATLAPDDRTAVEVAMLSVLSRRPTERERDYFKERLRGTHGSRRNQRLGDIYWSLLNSSEFSWNH